MVYRRLKTDSASLFLGPPPALGVRGVVGIVCSRQVGGAAGLQKMHIKNAFKKKNLLCCRMTAAEPMGAFWLRRVRDSARIGKRIGSPRVGNRGQMGFRGPRKAAGASSRRPARVWRPAARNAQAAAATGGIGLPPGRTRRQCAMTARHQKKPPGREPGAQRSRMHLRERTAGARPI
jgi:hypothetical protein